MKCISKDHIVCNTCLYLFVYTYRKSEIFETIYASWVQQLDKAKKINKDEGKDKRALV